MAPSKRRIVADDEEEEHSEESEEEVLDVQSAQSSLRQTHGKRQRLSLAAENSGNVVSDDDEGTILTRTNDGVDDAAGEDIDYYENQFNSDDEGEDNGVDDLAKSQHIRKELEKHKDNMPQEQGIIEEVFCRNFMCHSKLRIKLGPLINFIIGHNGSGKSAVLTALTLCLGARATATNRGASLKSFIKEGEESAMLSVKIKNQGEMAYQHDLYGDSIIIERHFTRAGTSSFKIKGANERVLTTKRADLEDMLDYLALQIDNPMNVLTQDMARQFLSSSSPADKYKFFIRGTQLEQLDRDYRVMESSLDSTEDKLERRMEDIDILKRKSMEAEAKKKLIDESQTIRERIEKLKWQYAWVQVEEQEQTLERALGNLQKADDKVRTMTEKAQEVGDEYDRCNQLCERAKEVKEALQAEFAPVQEKKTTIKEHWEKGKTELMENAVQRRQITTDLKASRVEATKLEADIETERERIANANGPAKAQTLHELEEARLEVNARRERRDEADKTPLSRELEATTRKNREADEVLRQRKSALHIAQSKLQELQKDQGDQSAAYQPKLRDLLRAIQNESRFRSKPVGPMGYHVRLLKPEWSSIIETTFGGNLEAFVVTNKQDQAILSELQNRLNCRTHILIGQPSPIDTSRNEPDPSKDTILRVLEIDNDLVRNQLIINQAIEQTVLIASRSEANNFMFNGSPPENTKATIALNESRKGWGVRLTYTRTMAHNQGPVKAFERRARMKTAIEAQIRMAQENIDQAKREVNDAERIVREAQIAVQRAKQALNRFSQQEQELRIAFQQAQSRVEDLEAAVQDYEIDAGTLDVLTEQLAEAEANKAQHENSYQDADDARVKIDQLQREIKKDMDQVSDEVKELEAKIKKADDKLNKVDNDRRQVLYKKNEAHGLIGVAEKDRDTADMIAATAKEVVAEFTALAQDIHPRVAVDSGMTGEIIEAKLQKLESEQERAERRAGGSREEILQAYLKAKQEYTQAGRELKKLQAIVNTLKLTMVKRKYRWRAFRKFITVRAQINFMYLLSERAFRGRIIVNHRDMEMDISVEPDISKSSDKGRQTKTLSGGEKSFSTICLLLSIWEAMGSPIRCLDEFDVFMDNVNRDISMKMMIQAARRAVGRQFILITPQAMNNVQLGTDVKIHKMSDPERGQTTLPFAS